MRRGGQLVLAILIGSASLFAAKQTTVPVCMENLAAGSGVPTVLTRARLQASRIMSPAGVKLDWHTDRKYCQAHRDQVILVSVVTNAPKTFRPEALAAALPFEGVHIQVFYDRIFRTNPDLEPALLAYVLVHEITHVLQNIDRHSNRGIMKARWDDTDYARMKMGQFWLTALDIKLIQAGLAVRAVPKISAGDVLPAASKPFVLAGDSEPRVGLPTNLADFARF